MQVVVCNLVTEANTIVPAHDERTWIRRLLQIETEIGLGEARDETYPDHKILELLDELVPDDGFLNNGEGIFKGLKPGLGGRPCGLAMGTISDPSQIFPSTNSLAI